MIVDVRKKSGRRNPVGESNPTYQVALTSKEIDVLRDAAFRQLIDGDTNSVGIDRVLASAATMLHWARWGRS